MNAAGRSERLIVIARRDAGLGALSLWKSQIWRAAVAAGRWVEVVHPCARRRTRKAGSMQHPSLLGRICYYEHLVELRN